MIDATFTPAAAADLTTAISLINEKFNRNYPAIKWYMLDFVPTAAADAGEARLTGLTGGVRVDTLYGEAVPVNEDNEYEQPHGADAAVDATTRRKWKAPISICAHVARMGPVADVLTPAGADAKRRYQLTVPTGLADSHGLIVQPGDKVEIAGVTAVVTQAGIPERGYWRFTNIPLYVICFAQSISVES